MLNLMIYFYFPDGGGGGVIGGSVPFPPVSVVKTVDTFSSWSSALHDINVAQAKIAMAKITFFIS